VLLAFRAALPPKTLIALWRLPPDPRRASRGPFDGREVWGRWFRWAGGCLSNCSEVGVSCWWAASFNA